MRRGRLNVCGILVATLSVVSCGDGGGATLPDPGPSLGLDASSTISGLSAADDATLCEWMVGRLGGYGLSRKCGDVTLSTPSSQAMCVSAFQGLPASCPITVGDYQSCVNFALTGPCPSGSIPSACVNLVSTGLSGTCQ